jgi:parvulin-like peptidyl-prolyl isomerase
MQMIRLTLDNVDKPNLQPITFSGKLAASKSNKKVAPEAAEDSDSDTTPGNDDGTKEPAIDPERDEALNILKDLVDLNRAPTTASTTASPQPPPN